MSVVVIGSVVGVRLGVRLGLAVGDIGAAAVGRSVAVWAGWTAKGVGEEAGSAKTSGLACRSTGEAADPLWQAVWNSPKPNKRIKING